MLELLIDVKWNVKKEHSVTMFQKGNCTECSISLNHLKLANNICPKLAFVFIQTKSYIGTEYTAVIM